MPTKDYNIQPYYDDFDETKGYHRVLFKPNFAVQARELTQAQTILQDQIQKNSSFENGESMSSGQLNVYTNIAYVSLSADLSSNETAESIVGKVITNQTSLGGVTAKIIAVAPKDAAALESLTIYIAYLDNTTTATTFADGNSLYEVTTGSSVSSSAWKTIGKITGYTSPTSNVGTGSIAQVESGIYYINGYATYVPKQTIILDKYTNTPTYKLGFDVSETITTSTDDVSLNDNSVTSTNYQAPGADRHKVQLTLSKRSLTVSSTEGFVEVCEVVNGIINLKRKFNSEKEREVISGLDYEIRENLSTLTDVHGIAGTDSSGSGNKISFGVSAGIGKIDGKEVVHKEKTYLAVDKARSSITKSSTVINSGAELGNYVVTDGDFSVEGSGDSAIRSILNFKPDSGGTNYPLVYFASTTNATNSIIGQARIRNIEREGVDYKIYLFDIRFNDGKVLSNASELHVYQTSTTYSSSNKICDLKTERSASQVLLHGEDVTPSTLRETDKNALLHEMPYGGISRITGAVSVSNIRQSFSKSASSATNLSFSISGATFDTDVTKVIVYGRRVNGSGSDNRILTTYLMDDYDTSTADITNISVSGNTITITSAGSGNRSFVESAFYTIIATIVPTSMLSLSNRTLDGNQQYDLFTTKTQVERKLIPLTKVNSHPYGWKVYMSADFGTAPHVSSSVDITERYTMDTGQREDFIDFASVKLKDNQPFPSGRIIVVYWHYPAGAGQYTTAQSYPIGIALTSNNGTYGDVPFVSNADGGTTYNLSDVPIYTSPVSGRKYRLNECVDLRPVKNSSTGNSIFTGSGSNSMIVPDKATISLTGIVQFLGRIDKIYLDSNGSVLAKSGVASMNPTVPEDPIDSIPLYNVRFMPYTYDLYDIVVESLFDSNERDMDFDAISSLEQSAKDYQLPIGRLKRNTFSDPFVGHGFGDVADDEFSASIDLQSGELRPRYKTEVNDFATVSAEGHALSAFDTTLTVGAYGSSAKNVVTLPYTHLAEIQNLNYNSERTLRNTDAITYNGVVYIKDWDVFKSTKSRPMIKNRTGDFDSIPYLPDGYNTQGTIWREWETEWFGVQDSHIPEPKLDMGYNELDKSPNYYNVIGKEIHGKKVEGNYTPYIKSRTFTINAYGLKPNCTISSVKFDGIEIVTDLTVSGDYADGSTRKTDGNGKFVATYTIPNVDEGVGTTKFTTGSKKVVISGNGNYAEGYYHVVGLFEDDGYLTKPYDLSWNDQTNETLFQEFEVFEETCITKLDLYFTAEDLFDRSVTVQIRKIEDDKPSNKILPYSAVSKIPSDFVASTTGTQVTFTFDETIFLKRGRYAIAIITPSVEYKVQTLKVEQTKGSKGTGVGNLYIGTQKISDEILRFSLYRAKFTATQDDALISTTFGNTLLNPNPLKVYTYKTATGYTTPTLEIEHEGHGFSVGDGVSFSGIQGRNEHDLLVTGTLNFSVGEIAYQSSGTKSGSVSTLVLTNGGTGYADSGNLIFTGANGTIAQGTFTAESGVIQTVTLTHGGLGYASAPVVSAATGSNLAVTVIMSDDDIYTVPYGRVMAQDNTKKTISIATESGVFTTGSTLRGTSSGASVTIGNDSNDVQTVKRLKGLHLGTATAISVQSAGSGYSDTAAGENGVAVTNYSGSGSGTGLRVKITTSANAISSAEVVFGGSGYQSGDVVTVSGGSAGRLTIDTAKGVTVGNHAIIASGFTADKYAIASSTLGAALGSTGYAGGENTVSVTQTKRRVDMIRYNAKQFIPSGTSLSWEESDDTGLSSTDSIDVNTNIYYTQPRYLSSTSVLRLTMSGDSSNDRVSPVFDFGSASNLVLSNITTNSNYISRKLELAESANSVYVVFDAMLSKGNSVSVYAKTLESSSRTTFKGQDSTTLSRALTSSNTTINLTDGSLFSQGDVVTIGEEDILLGSNSGSGGTNEYTASTRGHNGTDERSHASGNFVVKDSVNWTQLTQVGTTFDADFPEFKKMVYSIDNLSDFAVLQLRINMGASNFSMPPRIKNLRVLPNYKDDSLKPLQTKTLIVSKTNVSATSYNTTNIENIATDFKVEEATVFVKEVKLNSGVVTNYIPLSEGVVEIEQSSGGVKPLETTNNTGCTVRFKKGAAAGNKDITAVVILTGRRL